MPINLLRAQREPKYKISATKKTDIAPLIELLMLAPAANVLPGARLMELALSRRAHLEFSTIWLDAKIVGLLWHGVSVSLIGIEKIEPKLLTQITNQVVKHSEVYASIVGNPQIVAQLYSALEGHINEAREFRMSQLVMQAQAVAKVPAHPKLRLASMEDFAQVYEASVEMFKEELGQDPTANGGESAYLRRVRELIEAKRTYIVTEDNQLIFKADVGAIFADQAQIQGVYVPRDQRGKKIASKAMNALVQQVKLQHAKNVSLYVNDFNLPAQGAYRAAGFVQIDELATIMLK